MKSFSSWKFLTVVTAFLGVFIFGQLFFETQPPQVRAQGIDDVLEQFKGDFNFTGKDDVKRKNAQNANEQNREDIQLKFEEAREEAGGEPRNNTGNPATALIVVQVRFTSLAPPDDLDISLGGVDGFSGVFGDSVPKTLSFIGVTKGSHDLEVKCRAGSGPNCQVTIDQLVNVSCNPPSTFTINPPFPNKLKIPCNVG